MYTVDPSYSNSNSIEPFPSPYPFSPTTPPRKEDTDSETAALANTLRVLKPVLEAVRDDDTVFCEAFPLVRAGRVFGAVLFYDRESPTAINAKFVEASPEYRRIYDLVRSVERELLDHFGPPNEECLRAGERLRVAGLPGPPNAAVLLPYASGLGPPVQSGSHMHVGTGSAGPVPVPAGSHAANGGLGIGGAGAVSKGAAAAAWQIMNTL